MGKYSYATICELEDAAKKCSVVNGDLAHIVKHGMDREHIVRVDRKGGVVCECSTYSRLKICAHVMAALNQRGKISINSFVHNISTPKSSNIVLTDRNAGQKPNEKRKTKGRVARPRPVEIHNSVIAGEYMIVRGSRRIKVCHGCRISLIDRSFVLRHHCAVPYRKRSDDGELKTFTPSTKGNHYFHLKKSCVYASPHHTDFEGCVTVEPSISVNEALRAEYKSGDLVIVNN